MLDIPNYCHGDIKPRKKITVCGSCFNEGFIRANGGCVNSYSYNNSPVVCSECKGGKRLTVYWEKYKKKKKNPKKLRKWLLRKSKQQ